MKKSLSLILSLLMVMSTLFVVPFTVNATDYSGTEVQASALKTGDTFYMGMYPQEFLPDVATITALNAVNCTMTNYGYMQYSKGSSHTYDPVDMTYADIPYNGEVYRRVTINEYRPGNTQESSGAGSYQSDHGYTTGNNYYFRWEPIEWQVLDKESDGVYVMSKTLLDSQAYHNYYEEAVTWEKCSLREWLNEDFYTAAFSKNEKAKIILYTHRNDTGYSGGGRVGPNTTDNLWVLSYFEAKNSFYGFNYDESNQDEARRAQGTDYARSQGLFVSDYNSCSYWWLRSPGMYLIDASCVSDLGNYDYVARDRTFTCYGVRPAFKLSLDATVGIADAVDCRVLGNHNWSDEWSNNDTEHWHECTVCGTKKDETTHNYGDWTSVDDDNHKAVCTVCGAEGTVAHNFGEPEYTWNALNSVTAKHTCANCSKEVTETADVKSEITKPATCTAKGETTYTATFTNTVFETQTNTVADIDALGHDFGNNEKFCIRCVLENPEYKEPAPVLTPEEQAMPTEKKTEDLIKKTNTDKTDVKGSFYAPLMLKATSRKNTATISWKAQKGADGYIIYAAPCGSKFKRAKTIKNAKTAKYTFKKLKKGKYYKYMVVAYKKTAAGNRIMAKSKSVHIATTGGKKGNPTGVTAPKNLTVKKGKKIKIKASVKTKGKVETHIAKLRYESANTNIATVNKKGVVKANKKGTVKIYVYSQNGICKTVKVKVK